MDFLAQDKSILGCFKWSVELILFIIILIVMIQLLKSIIYRIITFAFGLKAAYFIDTKLTFVGVIVHELSHALMAVITLAHVNGMSLFNIIPRNGTLGEVQVSFSVNPILGSVQKFFVGIAPLISGTLILMYMSKLSLTGWQESLKLYIMISILYHMSISKQDLKVSIAGIPGLIIVIAIIRMIMTM